METWGSCSIIEDSPLGVSVIAMGQTATNNQIGNLKIYDLKKLNGGETLTEIPLSQYPFRDFESTNLELVAMEKLLESEEPIKEDPFSKWTEEVSESFRAGGLVPAGAKMEVRFFKSDVPVSVKWRASIFADGYVLVSLVDPDTGHSLMENPTLLHLSQLLSYDERKLFAFGTIDYGKRTTLTARTKVVDRYGECDIH